MSATWRRIIRQGLVAGLLGFVTVAAVFGAADLLWGRSPLYTAALLGATVFQGVTDPAQVTVAADTVLAYTGLHLLTFLVFGLAAAALAAVADRGWQLWFMAFFFFFFLSFHLEGAVQLFAAPVRAALSDVAIWGAGIAASAAMLAYLLWRHPKIRAPQAW